MNKRQQSFLWGLYIGVVAGLLILSPFVVYLSYQLHQVHKQTVQAIEPEEVCIDGQCEGKQS